jgi:hypothetical protein
MFRVSSHRALRHDEVIICHLRDTSGALYLRGEDCEWVCVCVSSRLATKVSIFSYGMRRAKLFSYTRY